MDTNIFRAYDVRGIYGKDITEEIAENIGKSFGTFLGSGKTVVVSRDTRNGGESLMESFISGLNFVGCNAVNVGMVTTPMMYFAVTEKNYDGGVSVTASHNPAEWNGFKMTKENGILCSEGMGMEEIRDIFIRNDFSESEIKGTVENYDVYDDYEKFIFSKLGNQKKMKVVLDPGHGASCGVSEKLFRKAGHDVFVINGNPDGNFPSRPSDPKEENVSKLKEEVLKQEADIGIAFDGDADRVAIVDNLGRYAKSGNVTIPILAKYYISKNKDSKIVHDVCCSSCVEDVIKSEGGKPIPSRVGHSFVMNKVIEEKADFGGEYSNHLYFSDIFGFDDAMFAGLKIIEAVDRSGKTLAEIVDSIPVYPASTVEEIECDDKIKFQVVSRIAQRLRNENYTVLDIDGVKAFDKENNWMLIRGSNTVPAIKINSEAKTESRMHELFDIAKSVVNEEIKKYENTDN